MSLYVLHFQASEPECMAAGGAPAATISKASAGTTEPRWACQGQGQITDRISKIVYRKIVFRIDVMFLGYCRFIVFLFVPIGFICFNRIYMMYIILIRIYMSLYF